jgi:hypothetical protein
VSLSTNYGDLEQIPTILPINSVFPRLGLLSDFDMHIIKHLEILQTRYPVGVQQIHPSGIGYRYYALLYRVIHQYINNTGRQTAPVLREVELFDLIRRKEKKSIFHTISVGRSHFFHFPSSERKEAFLTLPPADKTQEPLIIMVCSPALRASHGNGRSDAETTLCVDATLWGMRRRKDG